MVIVELAQPLNYSILLYEGILRVCDDHFFGAASVQAGQGDLAEAAVLHSFWAAVGVLKSLQRGNLLFGGFLNPSNLWSLLFRRNLGWRAFMLLE